MWAICKVFTESATILLLFFMFLVFWLWGMWDLGSPTRDGTFMPWVGRQTLNHWTTREVPTRTFFRKWLIPPMFPEHVLCARAMLKGQASLCPGKSHTPPFTDYPAQCTYLLQSESFMHLKLYKHLGGLWIHWVPPQTTNFSFRRSLRVSPALKMYVKGKCFSY